MWVGAPDALPLAGRQISPGTAYGTSYNGPPVISDQWVSSPAGATPLLAGDIALADQGLTTKLGHLLAPAGVRYIIVPNHNGPSGSGAQSEPAPASLLAGLPLQTDLRSVNVGDDVVPVFENAVGAREGSAARPRRRLRLVRGGGEPSGSAGSGTERLHTCDVGRGVVGRGGGIHRLLRGDEGARMAVGGVESGSTPAFGWAMSFHLPPGSGGAPATVTVRLSYSTPVWIRLGDVLLIVLWLAAAALLIIDRRRRSSEPAPVIDADWFRPMTLADSTPQGRNPRSPPPFA